MTDRVDVGAVPTSMGFVIVSVKREALMAALRVLASGLTDMTVNGITFSVRAQEAEQQ